MERLGGAAKEQEKLGRDSLVLCDNSQPRWNPDYSARASKKEKPDTHLTKLINMLEDAGYVTKRVHPPNRRTREIRITPRGYRLLEEISKQREASIRSLFKLVRKKEQLALVSNSVAAIAHYTWRTMTTHTVHNAESIVAKPRGRAEE